MSQTALEYLQNYFATLQNPPILVWYFDKAPEVLQKLSQNGGDEDWLVVIPTSHRKITEWVPFWIEAMDADHGPEEHQVGEFTVYIGSHA